MSLGLVTLGIEAPSTTGGGGGGGGAGGLRIPFTLRDDDGVLQAGIDLSGAGVVQISIDGASYANRHGAAPTSIGDGSYYYELHVDDGAVPPWVLLKVKIAGYQTVIQREEIVDPTLTDAIDTIDSNLNSVQSAITDAISTAQSELDSRIDDQTGTIAADILASQGVITTAIDDLPTLTEIVNGVTAQITTDHGVGDYTGGGGSVDPDDFLNAPIEGGITVADALRGLLSAHVGKVTDFNSGVLVFKSLDGMKTRWTVTTDESGRIALLVGDLT